jgi:hypothetical protein
VVDRQPLITLPAIAGDNNRRMIIMSTPTTDRSSTGTPSLTGEPPTDPIALIEGARGHEPTATPVAQSPDDSWSRGDTSEYSYFEPRKDRTYRSQRQHLPATDYGPAAPVVVEVRRLRDELDATKRRLAEATGAVKAADRLDRRETIAAKARGEKYTPTHGKKARAEMEQADLDAAAALYRAEAIEAELADALRTSAWPIRDTGQTAIDVRRAALAETLETAAMQMDELAAAEEALGAFERDVLAPLVDPDSVLDMRPPNAGPRWQPPLESPHCMSVREVLAAGRFQRVPKKPMDDLQVWAGKRPLPTLIGSAAIRPAAEVVAVGQDDDENETGVRGA